MEDPNGEWETEECNSEGKLSWILNKGLGLGKKILIAGFVITSAPLVLPPLLVISAIGFAVSVPSGIFLASYACTEKLMSKFLPLPYHHLENGENYYVDMEKEEEEERKDVQRGVETTTELEDEKVRNEDIKQVVDIPIEENGYGEDVGEDLEVGKEKPEEKAKEKPEEKVKEKPEENVVKSTNDKEDQSSLVGENQIKEEAEPAKVEGVVLSVTEAEESGDSIVEVTTIVIEAKEGQEKEDEIKEEEKAKETRSLLEEIRDEGKADTQKTPQESSTSKGDQTGVSSVELPVSRGVEEPKDAGSSSETGVQSTPSSEAKKKKNNAKKKPPQQQPKVSYTEEEIWEQIEAVRGIVGYKGTPQKTSIEELKALYIFTGVELPASLKEHSDLAEVDSRLQFLKSIIGVK
ncbi:hypothetical protein PanWU01x14_258530 [Parasponia andersonii]|uniref:Uncharacterized protein n=1 Tax=Parasponia andersonii TaxID=3476 RepID=A0A2P5B9L1_PARAD|nr:hypothetical protein PanWU01x14_258530 [Parasponia andersonii]